MYTMRDYIRFRGDLSVGERPLGEVDYAILCELAYLDMREGYTGSACRFSQMMQRIEAGKGVRILSVAGREAQEEIIRAAARSERFGALVVKDHVDLLDPMKGIQFSASTWAIDGQLQCVVFRGTDDSIAGWKEDFEMGYTQPKAQILALEYLKSRLACGMRTVVAGHSKGGNLAQYAVEMLTEDEFRLIDHVYLLDSPGMCDEIVLRNRRVVGQTMCTVIVPEYCVVGNLLTDARNSRKIVRSTNTGMMQHCLISWGIVGTEFAYTEATLPASERIRGMLDRMLRELPIGERQKPVDALFDSIEKAGITAVSQFAEEGPKSFERVLICLMENDYSFSRELLHRPIQRTRTAELITAFKQRLAAICSPGKKRIEGAAIAAAGLVFLIVPKRIISIIPAFMLIGVTGAELAQTIRQLIGNRFNFGQEYTRISFCAILASIALVAIVKNNTLFLIGSLIFGILFMLMAVSAARDARAYGRKEPGFWLGLIKCAMYVLYGLYILVAPEGSIEGYSCSVGLFMMIDGATRVLMPERKN